MGKIGLTEFIVLLIVVSVPLYSIILLFRSLKKEGKGFLKLGDAAQELNNKTLHEAADSLFESNKTKYQILYLVILQIVLSLLITAMAL